MNEKFKDLLESTKYAALSSSDKNAMGLLLENTDKELTQLITEGTLAGDVAQFTPILMPMVRRVYPTLIANELLGIQPMTMPTGFIYALTNQYIGTNNNNANPNAKAIIIELDGATTKVEGDTVFTDAKVLYVEGKKVLVATGATAIAVGDEIETGVEVTGIYTNEASFARILKGYTGTYTTAQGEQLGKDMKEIGFSIAKKSVEAKVRSLKGRYTVEMYQDLKAQHGLLADE
jgi:S1-C subfamily serine protease